MAKPVEYIMSATLALGMALNAFNQWQPGGSLTAEERAALLRLQAKVNEMNIHSRRMAEMLKAPAVNESEISS